MSISNIFDKLRRSRLTISRERSTINYCGEFINGYHDFFCAAFNTLYSLETCKIEDFSAQCRILITGNTQEIQKRFFHLRHADYGYHYGTTFTAPDFNLLKKHSGDNFPAILAAGMMHQSGFCREKCTALIADYPEYLPLVIHGSNDWVSQVRSASEKSFFAMLPKADIITVVKAYSEAVMVANGLRYDRSQLDLSRKEMAEIIRQNNDMDIVSGIISAFEPAERYRLYLPILCDQLISAETAEYLIKTENKNLKDRLSIIIISKYDLPEERLIALTESPMSRIRHIAARRLYERSGLWQDADKLLLDKSTLVREWMQYYFEKAGQIDLKCFYRANFPKPEAIKGFGECGVFADGSEIRHFASSENEKIAAAAIYALFRLTSDGNDDLYYDMIFDPRPQVSKAAFLAMHKCGNAVPEIVYNDIIKNWDNKLTVRRLVKLLCHNTGSPWNAMPWLIRLYNTPEEYIRVPVRIAVSKRSYIYLYTKELAAEIRRAMEESPLPDALAKEIYREIGVV